MIQIGQKIILLIFFNILILPFPLLAEDSKATIASPSEPTTENSSSPVELPDETLTETFRLTLQHHFNGESPLPEETIEISAEQIENHPSVLLEEMRKNFSKHLKSRKRPLKIDTQLKFLLPDDLAQVIGDLPVSSIKTEIETSGEGQSTLIIPADKREIASPSDDDKATIDWKGLTGQFTFTDQFESITGQINWAGLNFKTKKGVSFSWDKSILKGTFNAQFVPSQLKVDLPAIKGTDENQNGLNLQALALNFNTQKTKRGLELFNLDFKLGQFNLIEEGAEVLLKDWAITLDTQEQEEVVNLNLLAKMGQLFLPKSLIAAEKDLNINYQGQLAFQNLDAESLLGLQKTVREAQSQDNPMIMGMALFGKFMEVTPKLLARSPQATLNPFKLKTSQGNIIGQASFSLDGKKATSLDQTALLNATQVQAHFTIGKNLFKQMLTEMMLSEVMEQQSEAPSTEAEWIQLQKQAQIEAEQQIQEMVVQKWLVNVDKDHYEIVTGLKEGQLTINGQEIPLPSMDSTK